MVFNLHLQPYGKVSLLAALLLIVVFMAEPVAAAVEGGPTLESCIQDKVLAAPDNMTVGEIKATCQELESTMELVVVEEDTGDAVEERLEVDAANVLRPFTLLAHRQNYFLLAAHNFQGYSTEDFSEAFGEEDLSFDNTEALSFDNTEAQFQLSFKMPLAVNIFEKDIDIFAAYTARSFWQVYQTDISSPFRETNHQPEVWVQFHPEFEFYGVRSMVTALGVAHQSNGRSGNLSRSWNTVFADLVFHKGNFAASLRPWVRLPESDANDDNPDITDYLGHGEMRFAYKYDDNVFSFMSRNNLESGFSRGAVELGWSFPIPGYPYLKGYLQYFSGYGESLIDYNRYVNRIGIGLLFTDLL